MIKKFFGLCLIFLMCFSCELGGDGDNKPETENKKEVKVNPCISQGYREVKYMVGGKRVTFPDDSLLTARPRYQNKACKDVYVGDPVLFFRNQYIKNGKIFERHSGADFVENFYENNEKYMMISHSFSLSDKKTSKLQRDRSSFYCNEVGQHVMKCFVLKKGDPTTFYHRLTYYVIDDDAYTAPHGTEIVIECYKSVIDECVVGYWIDEAVYLRYEILHKFFIPERIVRFDKFVRSLITISDD